MNKLQITRLQSKEETAKKAGEKLTKILAENKNSPLLLMLSGGSAFSVLLHVNTENLGENVTISALDERFSQEKTVNNFLQFQKTEFYTKAQELECNFIGTLPRINEGLEDFAKRWEARLKLWREENPNGKIIAVIGMGPNGHTAGMFAVDTFNDLFLNEAWVVGYNVGDKNEHKERVTTTVTFFKQIDEAIVYIAGEEKKAKLDAVISKLDKIEQLPALVWHEIKNVEIFTDIK
jgi:6-phosphogluconolactonase/glucosamine-6-phosphate isomerase/deaminase